MTADEVDCPIEGCVATFDPVAAAHDSGFSCPGCGSGWSEFHEAATPDNSVDPEDVEIDYPYDEPAGVVKP